MGIATNPPIRTKQMSWMNSCCCHDDLIWILENLNTIPHFLGPLRRTTTTSFLILQMDWVYVVLSATSLLVFSSSTCVCIFFQSKKYGR